MKSEDMGIYITACSHAQQALDRKNLIMMAEAVEELEELV